MRFKEFVYYFHLSALKFGVAFFFGSLFFVSPSSPVSLDSVSRSYTLLQVQAMTQLTLQLALLLQSMSPTFGVLSIPLLLIPQFSFF